MTQDKLSPKYSGRFIKFVDTSRSKQLFNDEFEKCSKEPICIARKLQG